MQNGDFIDCVDNIDLDKYLGTGQNTTTHDLYTFAPTHHTDKAEFTAGDPCFVNPNSLVRIEKVLQHLGKLAKIKQICGEEGMRNWVSVVCDGLPYSLITKMLYKEPNKYAWLLLRPGGGHYGINMVKSFFDICWSVSMKELANILGFQSTRAQEYAKKAHDHHKSWQILETFLEGTCDELLLPYVRHTLFRDRVPSFQGYNAWRSNENNVVNPNYKLMALLVFELGIAILLHRVGMRRNHEESIMAGRRKISPVWFARNHPKYREIEVHDIVNRFNSPETVQEHTTKTQTFTTSCDSSKGESPDLLLENANKTVKNLVPPRPQEHHWQQACNNHEVLAKVGKQHLIWMLPYI